MTQNSANSLNLTRIRMMFLQDLLKKKLQNTKILPTLKIS